MTRPRGRHAPASSMSFYSSVARHAAGAVAVIGVVALVVVLATGDDEGAGLRTPLPSVSTPTGAGSGTPTSTPTETQTRSARQRERITIVVLNGTNTSGLAAGMKEQIVAAGFTVVSVGDVDADQKPVAETTVFYRPGAKPEADLLLSEFPDLIRAVKATGSEASTAALLTVVLGDDFRV